MNYNTTGAIRAVIEKTGMDMNAMSKGIISWLGATDPRQKLGTSTLYVALEPPTERQGSALHPSIFSLIELAGIYRVVMGSPNPVPEMEAEGAASTGLEVISLGEGLRDEDDEVVENSLATETPEAFVDGPKIASTDDADAVDVDTRSMRKAIDLALSR